MNGRNWSQEGYDRAWRFAAAAHHGQTVPGTPALPYIMHLSLVSMELMAAFRAEPGHDEELGVQCALLHDVIEDTDITYEQLKAEFGQTVADGVLALTKNDVLPKTDKMADSLHRIRQQPPEIWMVKLADRITNLHRPAPPHWTEAKILAYGDEGLEIHEALKEASPFLAARLQQKIEVYREYAGE